MAIQTAASGIKHIDCGNNASVLPTSTFMMTCWLRKLTGTGVTGTFYLSNTSQTYGFFIVVANNANGGYYLEVGNGATKYKYCNQPVSTTDWSFVCAGYDFTGNDYYLYLDGVRYTGGLSSGTPAGLAHHANSRFYIGGGKNDASTGIAGYDGMWHDVRLYNRLLTQAEIDTMFDARGGDLVRDGGLERWQCLVPNAGTTNIPGEWGGNTGVATNSPTGVAAPFRCRRE